MLVLIRLRVRPARVYCRTIVSLQRHIDSSNANDRYPRAGTLGGCVSHNALIFITPHASDWDNIASITGDSSWSSTNMTTYLDRVYEWQPVEATDPTIVLKDLTVVQHLIGGAAAVDVDVPLVGAVAGLANVLLNNPNTPVPGRDSTQGFYSIPLIMKNGNRTSVRVRPILFYRHVSPADVNRISLRTLSQLGIP